MPKTLKLFNGRAYICVKPGDPVWRQPQGSIHAAQVFVAAYNVSDVLRVITEYTGHPTSRHEIKNYWHQCWGAPMAAVTPQRGIWVMFRPFSNTETPTRLL